MREELAMFCLVMFWLYMVIQSRVAISRLNSMREEQEE